jgi:hypothetical protein
VTAHLGLDEGILQAWVHKQGAEGMLGRLIECTLRALRVHRREALIEGILRTNKAYWKAY